MTDDPTMPKYNKGAGSAFTMSGATYLSLLGPSPEVADGDIVTLLPDGGMDVVRPDSPSSRDIEGGAS